jgi:subtilisin family serine protease
MAMLNLVARRSSIANQFFKQEGNMAKRAIGRRSTSTGDQPRLGIVVRFTPKARAGGAKRLEKAGFKVASSSDFKKAKEVPNDLGGADVQYFERFGIAVIRKEQDRLQPVIASAVASKEIDNARPERRYRAIVRASGLLEGSAKVPQNASYWAGYRDGVAQVVERLTQEVEIGMEPEIEAAAATNRNTTWGIAAIGADLSRFSGAGIKVAILDTGFDSKHPDFKGRKIVRKLFASKSSRNDVDGHGTHCVGTACGPRSPASQPRYGVAYGAEIYAGKVLGDDGFGTDRSIMAGMEWALDQGCSVISMSLGADVEIGEEPNDDYEQIGQICLDSGCLVVAAAGNESDRPGRIAPVGAPANCPSILAIGAVDRHMNVASFSCGGINRNQLVDLAGPGVGILSAAPGGRYATMDGTSMATPHVAGIAALIAESDPKYRGWALWARLVQLARPLRRNQRDVGKGLAQAPKR